MSKGPATSAPFASGTVAALHPCRISDIGQGGFVPETSLHLQCG